MIIGKGLRIKEYSFFDSSNNVVELPNNKIFLVLKNHNIDFQMVDSGEHVFDGVQLSSKDKDFLDTVELIDTKTGKKIYAIVEQVYKLKCNIDDLKRAELNQQIEINAIKFSDSAYKKIRDKVEENIESYNIHYFEHLEDFVEAIKSNYNTKFILENEKRR